jgi:hypothetical protein
MQPAYQAADGSSLARAVDAGRVETSPQVETPAHAAARSDCTYDAAVTTEFRVWLTAILVVLALVAVLGFIGVVMPAPRLDGRQRAA